MVKRENSGKMTFGCQEVTGLAGRYQARHKSSLFSGNAFQIRHRLVLCRGEAGITVFVINASLSEGLAGLTELGASVKNRGIINGSTGCGVRRARDCYHQG